MTNTETVKQLRNKLGAYLSTPVEIGSGKLSTQQNLPATSLSQGGLDGRFELKKNGTIVSIDGITDRVKFGKIIRNNQAYYGIEALDENGDILFNEEKIRIQYQFSSVMSVPNVNWQEVLGWMTYDTTAGAERNQCVRLDFVKPSSFTITEATIYYRMQDYLGFGSTERLQDVDIYLNPTKTLVQPASNFDYYRFSGGSQIASNIDPTSDEYTGSESFTTVEIANINNGMNYLVAQKSSSSTAQSGFCVLDLVLTGYLQP